MKFKVNFDIIELDKKDLVRLEYHCCDVDAHHHPYLLIITTKDDPIRVDYVSEFRDIYEYFQKNKIEIKSY